MGYRHYFYEIDKALVEEIKNLTVAQLLTKFDAKVVRYEGEEPYLSLSDIHGAELHEFGKLYYCDTAKRIYSKGTPLFTQWETMEMYADYKPFIVGQEGLLEAIQAYKNKIINYYKNLLVDDRERQLFGIKVASESISSMAKMTEHVKKQIQEWECGRAVNTDLKEPKLTKSWQYEYRVFNLVRLLKEFDWEGKTILFYGW